MRTRQKKKNKNKKDRCSGLFFIGSFRLLAVKGAGKLNLS